MDESELDRDERDARWREPGGETVTDVHAAGVPVAAVTNAEELHAASFALGEALAGVLWPWRGNDAELVSLAAGIAIKLSLFHLPATAWSGGTRDFEHRVMSGILAGYENVFAERGEQTGEQVVGYP